MGARSGWLAALAGLLLAGLALPADATTLQPRVMGGTPAAGAPGVVNLAVRFGPSWSTCSAVVWQPRLLLTAGHCVIAPNSATPADEVVISAPGAPALQLTSAGVQGGAPVRVIGVWTTPGFVSTDRTAPPDDIAVLQLDTDLAGSPFTRLATRAEAARWVAQQSGIEQVGYGLIGPGQTTDLPHATALPARRLLLDSRGGSTFSTAANPAQSSCPGDSGSPMSRSESGQALLIGPLSGAVSACTEPLDGEYVNTAMLAIGYLGLLNEALRAAGLPLIPGPPQQASAVGVDSTTIAVRWQPPAIGAEAVAGYDVIDDSGSVLCQTADTTCTITGLAPGRRALVVRARNAQGEGDAQPPTARTTLGVGPKHRLSRPIPRQRPDGSWVISFRTLRASSSVAVRRYIVTAAGGRVICSGRPPSAYEEVLQCDGPRRTGTYRVRVQAVTNEGRTTSSAYSDRFRVR